MQIWRIAVVGGWLWMANMGIAADPTMPEPLVFECESIDLGRVVEGEICTAAFRFDNSGSADVRIKDVRTSCSCTTVGTMPSVVRPQERCSFAVKLNTKGKQDVVHSACLVAYEEGSRSFAKKLQIAARVIPRSGLIIVPSNLYLGTVTAGYQLDRSISLSQRPESVGFVEAKSVEGPQWMQIRLRNDDRRANAWYLMVDGKIPKVIGSLNERIIVRTDDKDCPEYAIIVTAFVEGSMQIAPRSIVQIVSNKTGVAAFRVALRDGKASEVRVLGTTIEGASDKAVDVDVCDGESLADKTLLLTARFVKPDDKIIEGAVLVMVRADGEDVKIRIPFLFVRAD